MKNQKDKTAITRGLIIREPWISMILDGQKDWEMRTSATKIRGPVALIAAGSGKIIGVADLTGVEGPLTSAQMAFNQARHRIPKDEVGKGRGCSLEYGLGHERRAAPRGAGPLQPSFGRGHLGRAGRRSPKKALGGFKAKASALEPKAETLDFLYLTAG